MDMLICWLSLRENRHLAGANKQGSNASYLVDCKGGAYYPSMRAYEIGCIRAFAVVAILITHLLKFFLTSTLLRLLWCSMVFVLRSGAQLGVQSIH